MLQIGTLERPLLKKYAAPATNLELPPLSNRGYVVFGCLISHINLKLPASDTEKITIDIIITGTLATKLRSGFMSLAASANSVNNIPEP
jgi:hypothetical protein